MVIFRYDWGLKIEANLDLIYLIHFVKMLNSYHLILIQLKG